jgi:pimeloyl-ACP methyl ester carboxylesterase
MHRTFRVIVPPAAVVTAALLAVLPISCSGSPGTVSSRPPDNAVRLERSVPSPIVLLHGMGGDGQASSGLTGFFRQQNLRYGGVVRIGAGGRPEFIQAEVVPEKADFFTLEMSDPFQSLQDWTRELDKLLAAIHEETGGARVVLVGHSAGGVAGRKYLVEHTGGPHVAKLVTVASPHLGSNLAMVPLFLRKLRDSVSGWAGQGSFTAEQMNRLSASIERSFEVPFDSPILEDLLPEGLNPRLAALNRSAHPDTVEYECVRALGGPPFAHWETIRKFVAGEIPLREVAWARILQELLAYLQGGQGFQGDGAVPVRSQDLQSVDFFRRHAAMVAECRGVEADHSGVKEEYQEILYGITSPARLLAVHRDGEDRLVVDFQDYFAGLATVTARGVPTKTDLRVTEPIVYQRETEIFGRVVIGPFDARRTPAVDIVVQSLDGRRYGRRVLLTTPDKPLPDSEKPKPAVLRLLRVEKIPPRTLLQIWNGDDGGPQSDLRAVLRAVDWKRQTPLHQNAGDPADLGEEMQLDIEPDEERITLELWDMDDGDKSDLLGRITWSPGQFPRGQATETAASGLVLHLDIDRPHERRIQWMQEPFVLPPVK